MKPKEHTDFKEAAKGALESLESWRDSALQDLDTIFLNVGQAVILVERGDKDAASELLKEACDLEFDLTGDCDAIGDLADKFGINVSPDEFVQSGEDPDTD